MSFRFAPLLAATLMLTAAQAQAQYQDDSMSQQQDVGGDVGAGHLQVQISQLQEQIRTLQGSIEQMSFQNKQLKDQLDKSNADTQYRLQALEAKQAAAATAAQPAPVDTSQLRPVEPAPDAGGSNDMIDVTGDNNVQPKQQGTAPVAPAAPDVPKFSTSRDLYSYSYGLLSHAKYAAAGEGFTAFTQRYPKDPLIGNAYYWLGETYYVRHDYLRAADNFRQGYQSMPTGAKAADNLLKLSMTLNALNKDKEACGVLKQVGVKFGASSATVKAKADQEMNRIGCS